MGRPRHLPPPRPAGLSRRGFFLRSGPAVAAAAALPLLGAGVGAAGARVAFDHGVASGDPLADRVILWTRVTPLVATERLAVDFIVARDPALQDVVRSGRVRTDPTRDWTVKLDVDGLAPATTYYYRFDCKGASSPVGRTRTLPVGHVEQLRLAVVSCSNFAAGWFNAYRRIAERTDLDLVIHLGDYLYEYGSGQYGDTRPCEPAHETVTLADYRQRHAQYKRDADAQALHRQHPLVAIWDDHETADNAWQGGAGNHQPDTEGAWSDRVAAALQAYDEWMPVRPPSRQQPRRQNRRFVLGDLVDLFMLEERLGARSQQLEATIATPVGLAFSQSGPFLDPGRTLLGDKQERWLIDGLRQSGARWKLLGQGVMLAQLKALGAPNALGGGLFLNPDQWDGYQPARNRLYAAIKGKDGGAPIGNLVVLTGDIHSAWAADLTQDPNNPNPNAGGYDPDAGRGALAVEFVGTSVSSPGLDDPDGTLAAYLRSQNPHLRYIDLNKRGYLLLDVTPERVVGEYWQVDTVAVPDAGQALGAAWQVDDGVPHLVPAAQGRVQVPLPPSRTK